ncbi:MAG: MATE family efflux transporter, partial [Spirochaetaceae bacterium]|nr:MATE family efflux transporter [Spirochaetaceae bacterium]
MKRDYSRLEIYRSILAIAWPSIVEQLLVMAVGIVSTAFVGRIGSKELAAVGLVGMIAVFIQTVFAGLATGSTV